MENIYVPEQNNFVNFVAPRFFCGTCDEITLTPFLCQNAQIQGPPHLHCENCFQDLNKESMVAKCPTCEYVGEIVADNQGREQLFSMQMTCTFCNTFDTVPTTMVGLCSHIVIGCTADLVSCPLNQAGLCVQECRRTYRRNRVGTHMTTIVVNPRTTLHAHYRDQEERRSIQLKHQESEYRLRLALDERDRLRNDLAHAQQLANDSAARCSELSQRILDAEEEMEVVKLDLAGAADWIHQQKNNEE